ncbi:DUF3099 domain-containing protein [Actinomadura sp. NPDC047616]|uniref:DUF3099 domain-containing protein n=1 Tax=Actinomadura sp. NPDC047616 TaxID=3155914 RepID=UPI00340620D6
MRRRRLAYGIMMGTCLTLFVLAWAVVRRYSPAAAVAMSLVAMVIPPFAAVVANWNIDREDERGEGHSGDRPQGRTGGRPGG